jgi:hypothetical protein
LYAKEVELGLGLTDALYMSTVSANASWSRGGVVVNVNGMYVDVEIKGSIFQKIIAF